MENSDQRLPQPNALQSPVSILPPEILSLVFQHTCPIVDISQRRGLLDLPLFSPPPKEKRAQFIPSAVCAHWRQVLFSTPHVWTSVGLTLNQHTVNTASAILQTFFAYSGQLPLSIVIESTPSWGNSTEFLIDASFNAVLYQNTHRIRELHLFGIPSVWIDLFPSLSNLVNLSMDYIHHETRPLIFNSHCSRLSLRSPPDNLRLDCSSITVLHLQDAPSSFCLEMLLKYPHMTEFRSRQPMWSAREISLPKQSFVLPCMETFEWSVNVDDTNDVAMLQHICIPTLRELIWTEEEHQHPHLGTTDPRGVFFRNLPPSLIDFHFHSRGTLHQTLSVFDIVCDSFDVEHLTFSGVDGPFLDHVFGRLTPPRNISGNQQAMKLRKLKAIAIKDHHFTPTELNQDSILQMLEHRFLNADAVNQEPFRLDFSSQVILSSQFKERLKEMIGLGLKVEIFEGSNSKLVDWL